MSTSCTVTLIGGGGGSMWWTNNGGGWGFCKDTNQRLTGRNNLGYNGWWWWFKSDTSTTGGIGGGGSTEFIVKEVVLSVIFNGEGGGIQLGCMYGVDGSGPSPF